MNDTKIKLIIAGSRSVQNPEVMQEVAYRYFPDLHVVSLYYEIVNGCASRGVDLLARQWASEHNVQLRRFPADWDEHDKAAGPIRNQEMVDYADELVAIWDGESTGTRDVFEKALECGLDVHVYQYQGSENE